MTIEQKIAEARIALANVEAGIAAIENLLLTPGGASNAAGLTATLADLQTKRTALQIELAQLEAALVVVAPVGAPAAGPAGVTRGPRGVTRGAAPRVAVKTAKKTAGAAKKARPATLSAAERKTAKAAKTFANQALILAKATLRMIGDNTQGLKLKPPRRPRRGR